MLISYDLKTTKMFLKSGYIWQTHGDRSSRPGGVVLVPLGVKSGRDHKHLPFVAIRK